MSTEDYADAVISVLLGFVDANKKSFREISLVNNTKKLSDAMVKSFQSKVQAGSLSKPTIKMIMGYWPIIGLGGVVRLLAGYLDIELTEENPNMADW